MRLIKLFVILAAFSLIAVGETGADRGVGDTLASQGQSCDVAIQAGTASNRLAQQQACCKGQKGVCGCRAGKIVCCDGKFSDSCTCNRDEVSGEAS
jgi:hypothetical protein